MRVAVIGAGVIGITSALAVKNSFPTFEVCVFAEKFSPETTGDGSAGLWSPYLLGNTPTDKIAQWGGITHRWLETFWKSGFASEIGLSLLPIYRVTSDPKGYSESSWMTLVYGAHRLTKQELNKLNSSCKANYKDGYMFVTYTCEPVRLLPCLTKQFVDAGGKLERRKIYDLNELLEEGYDLIVNCSGLGAKELIGDNTVSPIRGQVARVIAPWVKHSILEEDDHGNYIIPNLDSVVIGGTHQENDYDCTPRKEDSDFIYIGCTRIFPSIKNAEVMKEWVGLRPGKPEVRLETEMRKSPKGKKIMVIHNYGHGGAGVTLCWGCALNVVTFIRDAIMLKSNL